MMQLYCKHFNLCNKISGGNSSCAGEWAAELHAILEKGASHLDCLTGEGKLHSPDVQHILKERMGSQQATSLQRHSRVPSI